MPSGEVIEWDEKIYFERKNNKSKDFNAHLKTINKQGTCTVKIVTSLLRIEWYFIYNCRTFARID